MSEASFAEEKYLFHAAPDVEPGGGNGLEARTGGQTLERIPVIFAFPNTYSVGITSLGFQVIWAKLATHPALVTQRLFTDAQERLPQQPELLGFSFSWELDYANILALLSQLGIPLRAQERQASGQRYPLVFGGGPVLTANPEPYADFFDVILLGDGEELVDDFIAGYQAVRADNRPAQLLHLASIPGVYIPALYAVSYQSPTGPIAAISPW
jgi:radical SAM superfamily enzyme YgiQ (UPF0313 family)